MPWLADLVQSSESSLSVLPSQCLCEFLLMKDEKTRIVKKSHSAHETKVRIISPCSLFSSCLPSLDFLKEHTFLRHLNWLILQSVHTRVVDRLQSLLKGEEATELSTREIMEYFFNRLQSHDMKERHHAVKVKMLPAFYHFHRVITAFSFKISRVIAF